MVLADRHGGLQRTQRLVGLPRPEPLVAHGAGHAGISTPIIVGDIGRRRGIRPEGAPLPHRLGEGGRGRARSAAEPGRRLVDGQGDRDPYLQGGKRVRADAARVGRHVYIGCRDGYLCCLGRPLTGSVPHRLAPRRACSRLHAIIFNPRGPRSAARRGRQVRQDRRDVVPEVRHGRERQAVLRVRYVPISRRTWAAQCLRTSATAARSPTSRLARTSR